MFKDILKKIFTAACVIFTLLVFAFYIIGIFAFDSVDVFRGAMNFKTLAVFFAASLLISCLNRLFYADRLPSVLKYLLHYAGCLAVLSATAVLSGALTSSRQALIIGVLFTVIYAIVALIIGSITKKSADMKFAAEKYNSIFKKDNTK